MSIARIFFRDSSPGVQTMIKLVCVFVVVAGGGNVGASLVHAFVG